MSPRGHRPPGGRPPGGGRGVRGPGQPRDRAPEEPLVLPLPHGTDEVVPREPRDGDNIGLRLDRLIRRRGLSWELKGADRFAALHAFARKWDSPATRAVLARRVLGRADLPEGEPIQLEPGWHHLRFRLRQAGPMVVDYGRVHVLESSLSLDRGLGVPRVAGSALKGAARAFGEAEEGDGRLLQNLFGLLGEAGAVHLLDALPEGGRFELGVDVLTPHFGAYYRGDSPPGDWLSPVPTTFLTVVATTFVFDLEGRDPALVKEAAGLLRAALQDQGVGAKTAAGYGWFGEIR